MNIGGFPECDWWDVGFHNRVIMNGYNAILLNETVKHKRQYRGFLPQDALHNDPIFLLNKKHFYN
jgi:hypothetical protein